MNNPNQGGQNQGGQGGSRTSSPAKAASKAAAGSRSPANRTRSPAEAVNRAASRSPDRAVSSRAVRTARSRLQSPLHLIATIASNRSRTHPRPRPGFFRNAHGPPGTRCGARHWNEFRSGGSSRNGCRLFGDRRRSCRVDRSDLSLPVPAISGCRRQRLQSTG